MSKPAVVGVITDNYTFTDKFLLVKTRSKGIMHRFFENAKQLLYVETNNDQLKAKTFPVSQEAPGVGALYL